MDMYDILLARNLGGSGGTIDAYTKAQTDALLDRKVDKETGKGLSTNDFTDTYKAAVEGAAPQSTTYTKVEVDTALAAKLNVSDVDTALSSTSTNPVQNKAVQAPLARLVNAGAKNLLSVNSGSATDGYVFDNLAINLPSGSYVFLANIANYESRSELVIMADGEEIGGVVFNNADSVAAQFNITREGTIAKLYTNGGTFTNMMLCTEEDYAISPEFVPYAMSNAELTDNKQDKNTINIGTTSFDDIKTGGTYFSGNVGTAQNAPTSGYFLLNVIHGASDSISQEAYRLNTPDKVYRRQFITNAWSAWYAFTGSSVS